jgi:hypothetical protein
VLANTTTNVADAGSASQSVGPSFNAADNSFSIGRIKLEVTSGDITKQLTDAIVNSTNERLNLTIGRSL